jgi:hypothetical protein
MTREELTKKILETSPRSAWRKGVKQYALDLIDGLEKDDFSRETLLNGAQNWREYAEGGCALIYDADIAERLCNPSELKKTRNGENQPNSRETWMDVQVRALFQAFNLIQRLAA